MSGRGQVLYLRKIQDPFSAIANHLAGPCEIMEFPISHRDHPDEQLWSRFEDAWSQLGRQGIPADIGATRTRHPWGD